MNPLSTTALRVPVGFTSTTPTHVDSSIREVWAQRLLQETLVKGFWQRFVGPEGSGSPIIQKTELLGKDGDTIHINVTTPLTGAGQTGDTAALEGQEENLTTSSIKIVPEIYRHGVRWYRRANKKSLIDLREEARNRLREWGGEKMDDLRFANFVSQADLNGVAYTSNTYSAGGASGDAPAAVAAGDHLDVSDIQKIKLQLVNEKAKPVMSKEGLPFYLMVMHPNCAFNLKQDSRYEQWAREAQARGESNPLFTGALMVIDGMVLYEHPNVPTAADGAASIDVARNIAFGAEAFVEGIDEAPTWNEDSFDYEFEFGVAYSFAFQPRRALTLSSLLVYADAVAVV